MMRAPSSAWRCMSDHSSGVRLAGLSRIASGVASLPMSWKSAGCPSRSRWAREHAEPTQVDCLVRECPHAADEPVHDVVRQQPRELLAEDAPPALVPLQRERERDEAHVDGEVAGAGEQAKARDREPVLRAVGE